LGLVVGAIILCSAVGIIYYDFKLGGIGDGFSWNYAVEGLSRIGFSFPLGIVLYKVPRVNLNIPPFVLCVLLVLILVGLPKGTGLNIYPLFCIFVLFPLLVTLAAAAEPSENLRSIFSFLGMASYGIYATHKPVEEFVIGAALRVLHLRLDQFAPFSGLIFLAAILTAIGLIDTYFDRPVRRWLTQKSNRATPESSAAVEAVG
jgi:peptidoglycan/LPS O-acetylase OafA/YrhL